MKTIRKCEICAEYLQQGISYARHMNREHIKKDKALEYVLENYYDEVREAVFEQEAESRQE